MPRLLDRIKFAKIVTILAVTFGIAVGACGLTAVASAGAHGAVLLPLMFLEMAVMLISALGLVIFLILWIIAAATRKAEGDR